MKPGLFYKYLGNEVSQSISQSVILCLNIFKKFSLLNLKTLEAKILREVSPSLTCHVSHVMYHVSHVMCHTSYVICHMSRVTVHMYHVAFTRNTIEIIFSFLVSDKVVNLFDGGSFINRATSSC